MDALVQTANFLNSSGQKLFSMVIHDWGIIGMGMVAIFVLSRVVRFIKRMFM